MIGVPDSEEAVMKDRLTIFTKWMLDAMFVGGILVTLTLPFSIRFYGTINPRFEQYYGQMVLLFAVSGLLAVLIIRELRKIFASVLADDCFVRENVESLNRMGTYSFLIVLVSVGRACLYLTPAVLVIVLVFIVAGLFSKVLAQVFDRAVTYKLENDLTI